MKVYTSYNVYAVKIMYFSYKLKYMETK